MALINKQVGLGQLQGIEIGEGKQLTYQLFANNTEFFMIATEDNFLCVKEIIARYEKISSASLNLEKSTVIPMYLSGPIPEWLTNTRCKVAAYREVITYLGCPVGYGLTPSIEVDFLIGKVCKRLRD